MFFLQCFQFSKPLPDFKITFLLFFKELATTNRYVKIVKVLENYNIYRRKPKILKTSLSLHKKWTAHIHNAHQQKIELFLVRFKIRNVKSSYLFSWMIILCITRTSFVFLYNSTVSRIRIWQKSPKMHEI